MDITAAYCSVRRNLEERQWVLISRLAVLTQCLHRLIGCEHDEFLTMLDHCQTAALDIQDARDNLRGHRHYHRC